MAAKLSLPSSSPFFIKPNPNSKPPKPQSLSSFKITCNITNNTPPIAPWVNPHFVLPTEEKPQKMKPPRKKPDNSLTEKVSGARGKRAMKEILVGIGKIEKSLNNPVEDLAKDGSFITNGKKGPHEKPEKTKYRGEREKTVMKEILDGIGKMEKTLENPIEDSAKNASFVKVGERMPWERQDRGLVIGRIKREKKATSAELRVDKEVLKRLRVEAAKMRVWVKVKKAGVTQDVVDQVMIAWRDNELAMMKFDVPLKWNMSRACEIVEEKTGGLVVWIKKDLLVVYKGCNYKLGLETSPKMHSSLSSGNVTLEETTKINNNDIEAILIKGSLYEREADRLLDGLGPRFADWWMAKPLPVDGDLLPEVVPGFKPPFRLLAPPHARAKLTDYELTYLRKLARPLPTHFVIGRNRKLQGLAAAILKLWEKCHIVKIAVKWGVMNTNNEEMANNLKGFVYAVRSKSSIYHIKPIHSPLKELFREMRRTLYKHRRYEDLTGGVLLLRNKFIIIIYRGKDFLPCGVVDQVVEREIELRECQLEEERARANAIDFLNFTDESCINSSSTGTLSEYRDLQSDRLGLYSVYSEVNVQLEAEKERLEKQLKEQERKLLILQSKIKRSSRELAKLNSAWRPTENDTDQEIISEEERECFRKIGLKLSSSLLLGRRGVFKGVIEGVYQHWKHREIAKVITMQRLFSRVVYTAKHLEAETGGILVSVDKFKEGFVIILYRGKNHKRPQNFVSPNLLTKREALTRSLEMQRIGSLKFYAYQRQKAISELKCKLMDLEKRRGTDRREYERLG